MTDLLPAILNPVSLRGTHSIARLCAARMSIIFEIISATLAPTLGFVNYHYFIAHNDSETSPALVFAKMAQFTTNTSSLGFTTLTINCNIIFLNELLC